MSNYFATPEERHKVAERLRKAGDSVDEWCDENSIAFNEVDSIIGTRSSPEYSDFFNCLADLIEPTCSICYRDLTTDTPDRGYDPDGYYYCSCCGELDGPFDAMWDTYQAHAYEGEPPFRYCPHCGCRVVIPSERTKHTVKERDAAQFARSLRESKYGEDKHSATWVYDSILRAIHELGLEEKYAEDPLGTLAYLIDPDYADAPVCLE